MTIGQQAYSIVETHAGKGIQRTGGAGNADTINWLCRQMAGLGARVSLQAYLTNRSSRTGSGVRYSTSH